MDGSRQMLLSKLNKSSGRKIRTLSECWLWTGHITHGRGTLQTNYCRYDLGETYAHRLSYIFHGGSIPEGMQVNHLCEDKPGEHYLCCNPDHLVIGTQAQNMAQRDANLGAYQKKGADANGAKFTLEEARDVQQRHLKGEQYKGIAQDLNVNRRTIERICCGEHYAELGDIRPLIAEQKKVRDTKIIQMERDGKSRKDICKETGMSAAYICTLIKSTLR